MAMAARAYMCVCGASSINHQEGLQVGEGEVLVGVFDSTGRQVGREVEPSHRQPVKSVSMPAGQSVM